MLRVKIWIAVLFLLPVSLYAQMEKENESIRLMHERTKSLHSLSGKFPLPQDENWGIGKEYIFKYTQSMGTPFFMDELDFKGTVIFNGKKHDNLTLFHDLITRDLVLHHAFKGGNYAYICLNDAWIEEFILEKDDKTYYFLRSDYFDNKAESLLPEDFVEVIYNKELKLLFGHIKEISFNASEQNPESFTYIQKVYLIKDNTSFDVTRKSDFTSIFPHNKKQIRTFIRRSGFSYKKLTRSELISLMQLCEKFI